MCGYFLYIDSEYEPQVMRHIREVIDFAYSHVSDGIEGVIIEVSIDYDIDCSIHTGFCTPACVEGIPKSFEIELAPNLDSDTLVRTLIHEMIHVGQYLRGDLTQGHNALDGLFEIIWKGIAHTNTEYVSRPWEIEADELESKLYEKYKELN